VADGGLSVQKALLAKLQGALSCPVYDSVPQDAGYPYVTFAGTDVAQEDAINQRIERRVVSFSVWSDYKGQIEVMQIMSDMHDALHRADLELDSGRVAGCYVTRKATSREPDGETYQGQLIVELLLEL